MVDDVGALQARLFLQELHGQVEIITGKYEKLAHSRKRLSGRGASDARLRLSLLRRELYEVHRLIDGLHRRFPESQTLRVAALA